MVGRMPVRAVSAQARAASTSGAASTGRPAETAETAETAEDIGALQGDQLNLTKDYFSG